MYCGNNKRNRRLLNGELVLGTRYKCLRRGIGVGMNLPYDHDYDEYEPIEKTKIYCGKSDVLPPGYDRLGSIADCHRIGVGVGKSMKSAAIRSEKTSRKHFSRPRKSRRVSRNRIRKSRKSRERINRRCHSEPRKHNKKRRSKKCWVCNILPGLESLVKKLNFSMLSRD
jgi:hypothetical protein